MADYEGPERRTYIANHVCKQETKLALIAQNIEAILKNQIDIKGIIFGNGKEGLRSIQSRQATMQKIQWWAIGVILISIGGIVAKNLL